MKGGALVLVLYDYSQHGDPAIRSLLLHILSQVSGCGQYRLGVGGSIGIVKIISRGRLS